MMLRRRSPLRRSVAAPALQIPNAPAGAALFLRKSRLVVHHRRAEVATDTPIDRERTV